MHVAHDKVVLIHYTLTNDAGEVLDSSDGGEPLAYLHGQGNIVAGLEKALDGRTAGEKLSVRVEPAEGYGVRDTALVKRVPRRSFGSVRQHQARDAIPGAARARPDARGDGHRGQGRHGHRRR